MRGREKLVDLLCDRGILSNPSVERAFRTVDLEPFVAPELRALTYANAPIPFAPEFRGAILPSPMTLAALLQLLELGSGLNVAIIGTGGGYPAALVSEATAGGRVTVIEADAALRKGAAENLRRADRGDRVTVSGDLGTGSYDRVLILEPGQRPISEITTRLADPGFLIARGGSPEELAFRKRIRSGGEELEVSIADMPAGARDASEARTTTWARLLTRDALIEHAWEGRVVGHHDAHFAEGIEDTFREGPLDPERTRLTVPQVAARRAFHAAYILQCLGDLEDAEDLYARSLALAPSAEGHTFLGWTYSFIGDVDRAISECRRAIDTDPSLGNPYNDIGAYLIEQGKAEEAIPWLKRALEAKRYCCYFYAHTNLARVYLLRGQTQLARRHLEEALKVHPGYEPAQEMLRRISRGTDYVA